MTDVAPDRPWLKHYATHIPVDIAFRELSVVDMLRRTFPKFRCEIKQAAVTTSTEKKLPTFRGMNDQDYSRYTVTENRRGTGETVKNVHVSTLERWYPDGIKADIEGSELDMIDQGIFPAAKKIVFEYHFSKDRDMNNFYRRMRYLRKLYYVYYPPGIAKKFPNDRYPGFYDRWVYCSVDDIF